MHGPISWKTDENSARFEHADWPHMDRDSINNVEVDAGILDHEMLKFRIGIEYQPNEPKSYEYREINKYEDKIVADCEHNSR